MADLQDDEVVKLIQLYQSQENLFDVRMKAYNDRDKARESLLYISMQMGKNWDVETTKQKLKWLRNGYTRCRGMVEKSRNRGPSTEDLRKIKWKWFQLLDPFLRKFCRITAQGIPSLQQCSQSDGARECYQSQSTMDEDESVPDGHSLDDKDGDPNGGHVLIADIIRRNKPAPSPEELPSTRQTGNSRPAPQETTHRRFSPSPSTSSQSDRPAPSFGEQGRKRRSSRSPTLELIKSMRADFQERREERRRKTESKDRRDKFQDENDTFCMYIATQLRQLKRRDQRQARLKIQKVLFDMLEEDNDDLS